MTTRSGALLLLVAALGCSPDPRPELPQRVGVLPSLVPVLDAEGRPAAVAAIVRTTLSGAVLVAAPGPAGQLPEELVVELGGERLTVAHEDGAHEPAPAGPRLDLAVFALPRGDRQLRPVGPAAALLDGDAVRLVAPGQDAGLVVQPATVEWVGDGETRLAPLPPAGLVDVRSAAGRAAEARGAAVLSSDGALVGFVTGVLDERPVVTSITAIDGLLASVLATRGPDVLAGEDDGATLGLRVLRVDGLPTLDDEWGGPDLFLSISIGARQLPPIPLWEPDVAPLLVRTGEAGPVVIRFVERDVTLGGGDAAQDLAEPARLDALYPGQTTIPFTLSRAVIERHPETRRGPLRARVTLEVSRIDPEASSGNDRTPLGATSWGMGRVATGSVDLTQGDGSDFWALDGARQAAPVVVVLLRRDPGARVVARGYSPAFEVGLLELAAAPGAWLAVTRVELPAGRTFVRVSAREGPPTTYQLLAAPADDLPTLVRALFRLVTRAAEDRLPRLSTREFAREVAVGLTFGAQIDAVGLTAAILPELGHRTSEVRNLALNLLERHFPPTPAQVEEALALALGDKGDDAKRRALDLRLLAVGQRRVLLEDDAVQIAELAARDRDALMKLRALEVAVRVEDPLVRTRLTRLLEESDSTSLIRKARERLER